MLGPGPHATLHHRKQSAKTQLVRASGSRPTRVSERQSNGYEGWTSLIADELQAGRSFAHGSNRGKSQATLGKQTHLRKLTDNSEMSGNCCRCRNSRTSRTTRSVRGLD